MVDNKDLGKELLKSNGMEYGKISQEERQKFRRLVARDKTRIQRMKWATVIAWGMLAVLWIYLFLVGQRSVSSRDHDPVSFVWLLLLPCLFLIAILFTVSLYIRHKTATHRQMQSALMHIQEQLDRLSTGDQRPAVAQDDESKASDRSSAI